MRLLYWTEQDNMESNCTWFPRCCIHYSYDGSNWQRDSEAMVNYMEKHLHTHSYLYFWLVFSHLLALTIDVATIYFFDFILQVCAVANVRSRSVMLYKMLPPDGFGLHQTYNHSIEYN